METRTPGIARQISSHRARNRATGYLALSAQGAQATPTAQHRKKNSISLRPYTSLAGNLFQQVRGFAKRKPSAW